MKYPRPMRCRAVQQHLPAYRAGEGQPALRNRIAHHLHTCDSCYTLYRSHRSLEQEIRLALTAPPPADLNRVWQGIQRDLAQPATSAPPLRYALLVTALLLMLLVPMTFERNGIAWATPPTPPSPRLVAASVEMERATPAPAGMALMAAADQPVSTPDAPYRTESSSLLSIMTP
jgi:predicted anti-sigma-YlaC factor YlaD